MNQDISLRSGLDQPHLIAFLSNKIDEIYNTYLRLRRQVDQGEMKTIQAISDLKADAMIHLETAQKYLNSFEQQPGRTYLFSAETLLLNIIGNHQTSKINERQSQVPWKKTPSNLIKKNGSSNQLTEKQVSLRLPHKLSKSNSKMSLSSCPNKQNSKRAINSVLNIQQQNISHFSSRKSGGKVVSLKKQPQNLTDKANLKEKKRIKEQQDNKSGRQQMLSVRMTEEDYKEILRMKSEMGIE